MTRFVARLLLALMLGASTSGHAAVYCVGSTSALQNALSDAATNGEDNTIRVRTGTYLTPAGGFAYFGGNATTSLEIEGGWNGGCTMQTEDASLSVLDGQSTTNVLMVNYNGSNGGELSIRYLSLLHGVATTFSAALYAYTAGPLHVENCRFRLNNADAVAAVMGIVRVSTSNGPITFLNNVVANNSALGSIAVLFFDIGATTNPVTDYINGNTIADNAFSVADPQNGAISVRPDASVSLSNNILWNNGGTNFAQNITIHPVMIHNDVDIMTNITPGAGSSGNLAVDPKFVSLNNHHLQDTTPLYNGGVNDAPGGIGVFDLDGNPRIAFGAVDIGAYELLTTPDFIFANGFDGS